MQREITMTMADGSEKTFAFNANGGTAIRFRMVFKKELLDSITSIVKAAGTDKLSMLLKAAANAEATGIDEISLEEIDPELLQVFFAIAGSGELNTISQLAYIMNKSAEGADMRALDVEGYLDWLEQFETMEFLTHAMDFLMLYMNNKTTTSKQKKSLDQLTGK